MDGMWVCRLQLSQLMENNGAIIFSLAGIIAWSVSPHDCDLADPPLQIIMGPENLGSTTTKEGVWEIIYRLHLLIQWGTKDYADWFENSVLADFHPPGYS